MGKIVRTTVGTDQNFAIPMFASPKLQVFDSIVSLVAVNVVDAL